MTNLRILSGVPLSISPEASPAYGGGGGGGGSGFFWWLLDCHGALFNLALIIPSAAFVVYLASHARRSYAKLTYGRSYIMIAYYALLWTVCALNLLWCLLQALQCNPAKEFSWNILSLFTKSGMLFLEISLVAFLLQGNGATGSDTLARTFVISGIVVAADILVKVIYVFGFGVTLFIDGHGKTDRVKWGLWISYELLLSALYGFILFMHHSKWRERLPARPAFYNYICAMFLLNVISLFACVLAGNGAGFGFWLYDLTTVCYHSLYLPLLYVTFLADFFQEEDLRLENVYYSEMKDAGFFDADWD
ncbi:transmembrane protein adipocyte-associated 1-like protein [Iris pallida]|uniref:Transmembrane protein adipocyte-associated 1-like protein n=1 Tax=Iris pallida TaxID=29817 RepID=A0AAX6HRX7_IRIPA|nr:transmembrane protein adipocyte-associated 1-like protein [Iris pallida]